MSLWNDQELDVLKTMRQAGASYKEIADVLERRSSSAVRNKLLSMRDEPTVATKSSWSEAEDARVIELRKKGLSYADIAADTGRTRGSVKSRCATLGLVRAKGSLTQREVEIIQQRTDEGADAAEISKEINRSADIVRRAAQDYLAAKLAPKDETPQLPRLQATTTQPKFNSSLLSDERLNEESRAVYQQVITQASTVEMVIFTLWKMPKYKRPLGIEDAAVKLVRLIGHGPEYFYARRAWTINDWFKHLATIKEEQLP